MTTPFLTPKQIVTELDKYIIGQEKAKRAVAVALRNRWRRQQVADDLREEIMPNNIILIGPTGVGKTEIARRLAKLANAPFVKVEATKFTEVGYVGKDVESMVRDLVEISVNQVKHEQMSIMQEKAYQAAIERVLDILIPPVGKSSSDTWSVPTQLNDDNDIDKPTSEAELNERTREKFREKLKDGSLNDRMVEIQLHHDGPGSLMQVIGTSSIDDLNKQLQDIFDSFGQKKPKKRKLKVNEAVELLTAEEAQKLIDMEAIKKEALERAENNGIIFIDEIDKIAVDQSGSNGRGGPDVSRSGVQRDLLPIVEGSSVSTKYGTITTDHILFIASGAFHMSKPSDLIPELQGRFPIRVELNSLHEDDFVKILTIPENALTRQYEAILGTEGIEVAFTEDGIRSIAKMASTVNNEIENIGARRLHTILTTIFEEILFAAPDTIESTMVTVNKEMVENRLSGFVKNRDLSRYIL